MEKKFKCKEEILFKHNENESAVWIYAVFSSYSKDNTAFIVSGGLRYNLDSYDILPYEGNEHLVGTSDEPDEEVRLEKGDICVFFDAVNEFLNFGIIGKLVEKKRGLFCDEVGRDWWNYAIRISDFNPDDMEETKKHILVVKNGKVVKYKG